MNADVCASCGGSLAPAARFCTRCGHAVVDAPTTEAAPPTFFSPEPRPGPTPPPSVGPVAQTSGAASASLILGVLTWLLMLILVGFVTGYVTAPIAIALGMVGRRQIRDDPVRWRGNGIATAGLTLGMAWMLLATAFVSLLVWGSVTGG